MLVPGLNCCPNGPVRTNLGNFWQNLQQASVGLFWDLVFRYHFRGKLEENLAALVSVRVRDENGLGLGFRSGRI